MEYRTAEFTVGEGAQGQTQVQDYQLEFDESKPRGSVFYKPPEVGYKELIVAIFVQVSIIVGGIIYYIILNCNGITEDDCKKCTGGEAATDGWKNEECELKPCKPEEIKVRGVNYATCASQQGWIRFIVICVALNVFTNYSKWRKKRDEYLECIKDQEEYYAENPDELYVERSEEFEGELSE